MYRTILLPLAKRDIQEAAIWYNTKQKGLGKKFTSSIRKKVHFIRQNPKAVSFRYGDSRTAVLDRFPYMIHFTVDDHKKIIIISAVLSMHRNPQIWKTRK